MFPKLYKLNENNEPVAATFSEFLLSEKSKQIRDTTVGPYRISTIFSSVNLVALVTVNNRKPILFETMIFDSGDDSKTSQLYKLMGRLIAQSMVGISYRHTSYDEAVAFHDAIVATITKIVEGRMKILASVPVLVRVKSMNRITYIHNVNLLQDEPTHFLFQLLLEADEGYNLPAIMPDFVSRYLYKSSTRALSQIPNHLNTLRETVVMIPGYSFAVDSIRLVPIRKGSFLYTTVISALDTSLDVSLNDHINE